MAKKLHKPDKKFVQKKEIKFQYRYVSYRIRSDLLDRLKSYVDKETSASALVGQIIEWALDGQKGTKP